MTKVSRVTANAVVVALIALSSSAFAADHLTSGDQSLLEDIAQATIAEVESGKLAVEKSANGEVKKFAHMMVDDHSQGLTDVKILAAAKSVDLPDGPDAKHKAVMIEFKTLSGGLFDSRYVKQAGVGDHEATEKLLKKTQAQAKDADLKALATKMLPVVQGHLQHARELATKTAGK
jgi:putative membrane protein